MPDPLPAAVELTKHITVEADTTTPIIAVRDDPSARQQLQGGGADDNFFAVMYTDDAIPVEIHWSDERCLAATASLATDHYMALGDPSNGEPNVLGLKKLVSWLTRQLTLGIETNTNSMRLTLPQAKVDKLRSLLDQWPATRTAATLKEVWSLQGYLWHATYCARPGRYFVWRLIALTQGC
jgi:hypothetical protein